MRTSNKVIVGLMGLGVLAASYKTGGAGTEAVLVANGAVSQSPVSNTGPSLTPTPSASHTSGATSGSSTSGKTKNNGSSSNPAPRVKPTSPTKPVTSVTPVTPVTPVPPVNPPPATSVTQSGSAVSYRYGTLQVSVTKSGATITGITMLQSGASGGRQQTFPTLISWAKAANGSGFQNYSGATFTTDAFKKSLDAALAKF